jgi:hypothetical protein
VPRPRLVLLVLTAGLALAAAGCGGEGKADVPAFLKQARTPAEREVLRSIAVYRTTKDAARACALVTPHFLDGRFQGTEDNCEQVQRQASRHLPDSAKVQAVSGERARVLVDEPTATRSVYEMRRLGGTWKIDDIVEPKG